MAKTSLSNNLVGRRIRPNPDYESINIGQWHLKPNASDQKFGEIVAAWEKDGSVRVLVRGPHGDMAEMWVQYFLVEGNA